MNNVKLLTALQLKAWFSINKALHSPDQAMKRKTFVFLIFTLFGLFCFSFVMFSQALAMSTIFKGENMVVIPTLMYTASFMISLMSMIARGGAIFTSKDLNLQLSFPVSRGELLASRFFVYYLWDLFTTCVIIVPVAIVYFMRGQLSILQLPLVIVGILLEPILPVVLGVLVSVIANFITMRLPGKNSLTTILRFILVGLLILFSMRTSQSNGNIDPTMLGSWGNQISSFFPLALFFGKGFFHGDILSLLLFVGITTLLAVITFLLLVRTHARIVEAMQQVTTKKAYRVESALKTPESALLTKERKMYFSSPNYVINTIIGGIMAIIFAVVIVVQQTSIVTMLNSFFGVQAIPFLVAILISLFVNTASITASSISVEGKNFPLLKSFPISASSILRAKRKLQLSLYLPLGLIAYIIVAIGYRFSVLPALLGLAIMVLFCIIAAGIGQIANLHYPKLDWQNIVEVVKQGIPVIIAMFSNLVLAVLSFVIFLIFPSNSNVLIKGTILIVFLLAITLLCLRWLKNKGSKKLLSLSNNE